MIAVHYIQFEYTNMTQYPPQKDKRLVWQLLNYWQDCRGDRDFPALSEIDSVAISHLWPHCFVLDTRAAPNFPYFQYLGPELAKYSGVLLSGQTDWNQTLLDKAVGQFNDSIQKRLPVLVEDEMTLFDGAKLLFRSVILPLSDDQDQINYLLGGANGKIAED